MSCIVLFVKSSRFHKCHVIAICSRHCLVLFRLVIPWPVHFIGHKGWHDTQFCLLDVDCPPWVCQKVLIKGLAIKRQLAVFHGKILLLQGEEINGRSSVKTWRTTARAKKGYIKASVRHAATPNSGTCVEYIRAEQRAERGNTKAFGRSPEKFIAEYPTNRENKAQNSAIKTLPSIAINTVKREILCLRGATVLVHTEFARVIKV